MSVGENGGHLSDFKQKKKLFESSAWNHASCVPTFYCRRLQSFTSMSGNNPVLYTNPAYRLMIVDRPVLCHLRMNTRGCGRRGWGSRPNPRARPGRALWHKEGSVGPPQFDAVVGHASKNLGVWLCNTVFQLQPDALIFKIFKSDKFNQFWIPSRRGFCPVNCAASNGTFKVVLWDFQWLNLSNSVQDLKKNRLICVRLGRCSTTDIQLFRAFKLSLERFLASAFREAKGRSKAGLQTSLFRFCHHFWRTKQRTKHTFSQQRIDAKCQQPLLVCCNQFTGSISHLFCLLYSAQKSHN